MSAPRFRNGDLVQIAENLGPSMSHFTAGCRAIVVGSYADQYGGKDADDPDYISYTLDLEGRGKASWYYGGQLTLIEQAAFATWDAWRVAEAETLARLSDLDWVFAHGPEVAEHPKGATLQALASCFGLTNLWGAHGEGIDYFANAHETLARAKPFLLAHDKAGYLAQCTLWKTGLQ